MKTTQKREKDNAGKAPLANNGWFAGADNTEISDAARATLYAKHEDEHVLATTLVNDSYERDLSQLMPRPRGARVSVRDTKMWSGVSFISSIPVVAGLGEAAVLTAAPLVVAVAAAALPVAGIAINNAVHGIRVARWQRAVNARRTADRPRVDRVKAAAYAEARELQAQRWAITEAAVAALRDDVTV